MTYQAVPFGNFSGGLNLKDKADVVKDSEAIDLLNVEFTERGAVKQRDGYLEMTGLALTNRIDSLGVYSTSGGTRHLLAGCGTRLEAINTAGGVVASATGLTGGPYSFARFAAPGSEHAYAGNGSDTIRRWDGAAWTAPTGTVNGTAASSLPKAGAVCVTSGTNRLVATAYGTTTTGGPGGAASSSNPSRVHFSNVGDPTVWETDGTAPRGRNFVDLTPGDGESILSAVAWQNKVFVFKESKFFVFEGETVQANGTPVFLYQAVDTGVGLAAKQAVTVGRDGVYFMSRQGVYVTNGGPPVLLSEIVEPMWLGGAEVYFQSNTLSHAQIALTRMAWHDERLYVAIPTGSATTNDRVLVHDLRRGWWSLWDLPASALVSFRRSDQAELHFGFATGALEVGRVGSGLTTDNGVAIVSRWRSGWFDYSSPMVKRIRESKLWGSGAITANFSKDFERAAGITASVVFGSTTDLWGDGLSATDLWADGTNTADLWGGAGQISAQIARKAIRGTVFSTEFVASTSAATWSVHRVARHLHGQRVPSVVGTER